MSPAEAAYFDGNHCQHLADREEHQRHDRIRQQASSIARASRSWDSMADRLAADHRDYRARLADAAARINGGQSNG